MAEKYWEVICGHGEKNFTIWQNGDFGPCFESLAFGCLPQFLIAVISAYHIGRHQHRRLRGVIPLSITLHARLFICILLALTPILLLILICLYELIHPGIIDIITYIFQAISWLVHSGFIWRLHRLRHLHIRGTPGMIFAFISSVICIILRLRSAIIQHMQHNHWSMTRSEEYSIYCLVLLHGLYALTLFPYNFPPISTGILNVQEELERSSAESHLLDVAGMRQISIEDLRQTAAEDGTGILSKIIFSWVRPVLKRGANGLLSTFDDLYQLPKRLQTDIVRKYFSHFMTIGGDVHECSDNQHLNRPFGLPPIPNYMSYGVDVIPEVGWADISRDLASTPEFPQISPDAHQTVSLLRALHCAFGLEYYILGFIKVFCDALTFFGPILLNWLVIFMENQSEPEWHGYVYACLLFVSIFLNSILSVHFNYMVSVVGFKVRAAVITTIYKKSMSVSSVDLGAFSSGEIVNFMSIDTDRVVNYCQSFHQLWSLPVQVAVALYLLYLQVGIAFLAGVGFAVLLVPINKWLANRIGELSASLMKSKDARIKVMSELIYGIRIVKFYAWENHFMNKITSLRNTELVSLRWRKLLDACCVFFWATTPVLISLLTFITYVLGLGHKLTAAKVFTCLAAFNILITPLNAFPWVLNGIVEAWISLKRIQCFLNLPDLSWAEYYELANTNNHNGQLSSNVDTSNESERRNQDVAVDATQTEILEAQENGHPGLDFEQGSTGNGGTNRELLENSKRIVVDIRDACFTWQRNDCPVENNSCTDDQRSDNDGVYFSDSSQQNLVNSSSESSTAPSAQTLKLLDINLTICKGSFVGVIGKVGCGKSSLLSAIAGEMLKESGSIFVEDVAMDGLGLVTQESWIQHATVRDNILFGRPLHRQRYDRVIEACALLPDLRILPAGDMTEVGENGVTLSGGQKARISLARAVYQDKSIYLLDDPLSAVDAHVAQHLYDQCIMGLLQKKTRILATHHTKFLANADIVIVLDKGNIIAQGPPSSLQSYLVSGKNSADCTHYTSESPRGRETPPMASLGGGVTETLTTDIVEDFLVENEVKDTGVVKLQVYKSYWKAAGHCLSLAVVISLILMQVSRNIVDWWLSYWISHSHLDTNHSLALNTEFTASLSKLPLISHPVYSASFTLSHMTDVPWQNLTDAEDNIKFYLTIYGSLAGANSLFTLARAFSFAYAGLVAASALHIRLLDSIIHATVGFFDRTPVGRIINRFSSDVYSVDDSLPFVLNIFLAQLFGVIGSVVICCYGLPLVGFLLLPLAFIYYFIQSYYRRTSRELKRISSVTLSPIYAHFQESILGLITIRALRHLNRFGTENVTRLENNQRSTFMSNAVSQWLNLRIQLIGVALVAGVAGVAILEHRFSTVGAGLVGLAISYALSVTGQLSGLIVYFTETEKEMVGVERMSEYIEQVPCERQLETAEEDSIPDDWPRNGKISFHHVYMRYRDSLPDVLCDLTFVTRPGEKIGIVGRTGAGKSSLFLALFRIVDIYEGSVYIDDVDIRTVALQDYRSRLAIIPQDPFLFSGTLRENVDPCRCHTDRSLMETLAVCHLGLVVEQLGGLDGPVSERGRQLSVGQRQLVCLARAMLSQARILCIDEATASIDLETDRLLQEVINRNFHDRTVLTIAHRISTVINSDRVMVLSDGCVAELDTPAALLNNPRSLFYSLYHGSR